MLDDISYNNENILRFESIKSLAPKAKFVLSWAENEDIDWQSDDITQPSEELIQTEIIRLKAEYDANNPKE